MRIEQLHDHMILITLSDEDMRGMGLSFEGFSADDAACRRALTRLLMTACRGCGIDCRRRRFLIEALPTDAGAVLLVTVPAVRRRYRIKSRDKIPVYVFADTDAMLDGARKYFSLFPNDCCALYKSGYRYILICEHEPPILCEFAELVHPSPLALSRIKEHAAPIAQGNALSAKFIRDRKGCRARQDS